MTEPHEKQLTIPSTGATLDAVVQHPSSIQARGILVVCHPHPLNGGSMDNNVVEALCDAALQEGLAALRFNFRGVGRSTGAYSDGDGEQDDVLAALGVASELQAGGAVGLAGYSFGASMAARVMARVDEPPRLLILVSPPLPAVNRLSLAGRPASLLLISGDRDRVCPAPELRALATQLKPPADCVIVNGADHSWLGHEAELRDTAGSFLRWHLT